MSRHLARTTIEAYDDLLERHRATKSSVTVLKKDGLMIRSKGFRELISVPGKRSRLKVPGVRVAHDQVIPLFSRRVSAFRD